MAELFLQECNEIAEDQNGQNNLKVMCDII